MATALYRRFSLPFRLAFTGLEAARRRRVPKALEVPGADPYVQAHTRHHRLAKTFYGYHRVFDLVRNFHPSRDPATLDLLSLGPRTEIEFYYLWLFFGFSWNNLTGLDIVSTTPKIHLGDLSIRLPFPDNRFDVIVASHVLEKSRDPERTRDEILRVSKPGAVVLVGGDRAVEGNRSPIPTIYFKEGVHGFIERYGLSTEEIQYLHARSPHGYEIIFKIRK